MSQNEKIYSETTDSYDDKFVAIELEEGIEEGEEDEEDDFESKVSSTYIESNEEFMYSTKDLLPGPLKLELVQNYGDNKASFKRGNVKQTVEFGTARNEASDYNINTPDSITYDLPNNIMTKRQ